MAHREQIGLFTDNVNVIVETVAAGMGLEEYLDVSVRNAPAVLPGVEVVSREVVPLTSGELGGRPELRFSSQGRQLASLGVIGVKPGRAAVATLRPSVTGSQRPSPRWSRTSGRCGCPSPPRRPRQASAATMPAMRSAACPSP